MRKVFRCWKPCLNFIERKIDVYKRQNQWLMKIFAIESSAKSASAALIDGGVLLGEFYIHTQLTHSETLMPMAEALLQNTRVPLEQVDVFAEMCIRDSRKSFPASMNFFLQFPAGCDIINVAKSHASSGPLVPFAEAWAEIQGGAEV